MFLQKSISYFINIMYKHIFLNFGVISFMNKEIVSLFQLHTYKFGLVYIYKTKTKTNTKKSSLFNLYHESPYLGAF